MKKNVSVSFAILEICQYTCFTFDRYIILACIFGCRQGDIDHEYTRFRLITSSIVHGVPALTFSRPSEYQSDKQWLFFLYTQRDVHHSDILWKWGLNRRYLGSLYVNLYFLINLLCKQFKHDRYYLRQDRQTNEYLPAVEAWNRLFKRCDIVVMLGKVNQAPGVLLYLHGISNLHASHISK